MSVRTSESYSSFVRLQGERVRLALIAVFGPDTGAEATSEALAYGWQHWERVSAMENPTGYLYAVGRNWARRHAGDVASFRRPCRPNVDRMCGSSRDSPLRWRHFRASRGVQ